MAIRGTAKACSVDGWILHRQTSEMEAGAKSAVLQIGRFHRQRGFRIGDAALGIRLFSGTALGLGLLYLRFGENREQLERGQELYAERCADCHGPQGRSQLSALLDWPERTLLSDSAHLEGLGSVHPEIISKMGQAEPGSDIDLSLDLLLRAFRKKLNRVLDSFGIWPAPQVPYPSMRFKYRSDGEVRSSIRSTAAFCKQNGFSCIN